MLTLLYPAYDQLTMADWPDPRPSSGEVRMRVSACGICGSELEAFKSRSPRRVPPLVMGHEFCGVIDEVGPNVPFFRAGDRVVSHSLFGCRECLRCRTGRGHLCARRQLFGMHMPGGFAEYVVAPERSLIRWPDKVPAEAACLAEPAANGVHVVNLVKHLEPESLVVIGAGPIGLFCQQAFSAMLGLKAITCDMIPERVAQASNLGAGATINPRNENVVKKVFELTNGEGADVVVDAVGGAITKRLSLAMTRPGGATVWIGLHENSVTIDSHEITLAERQVHGSYAASMEELQVALDLIADGKIDATSWTTPFRLNEGVTAFHRMLEAKGNDIKAVLVPQ